MDSFATTFRAVGRTAAKLQLLLRVDYTSVKNHQCMGLDLLPILPRALPSGSAEAVVGQRARPQQHCHNVRFLSARSKI
jgi:hypothetical protein